MIGWRCTRILIGVTLLAGSGFGQLPAPVIPETAVVNAGSFVLPGNPGHAMAPGSIVALFGENLGLQLIPPSTVPMSLIAEASTIPVGTSLGGLSVEINGSAAPIFFISPGQINLQLPWAVNTGSGTATVQVKRQQGNTMQASALRQMQVADLSPGFFTLDFGPGRILGVNFKLDPQDDVIHASITEPVGSIPGAMTQPAKIGGVVLLFANGLGPVTPAVQTGNNTQGQLVSTNSTPTITIGGVQAQVLFSGLSADLVGLNQINIIVPQGVTPGNAVPIRMQIGALQSRPDTTIAIRAAP